MLNKILWVIGLSIVSGILYRGGGMDRCMGGHPKERDWGCSLIALICLWILTKSFNLWAYLACFCLSWLALSAYWKGKKTDMQWYHWSIHGFGVGLAAFPLYWLEIAWWLILARAVILGLTMMWWSENNDDVFWEEGGRGALITLTLPILLI